MLAFDLYENILTDSKSELNREGRDGDFYRQYNFVLSFPTSCFRLSIPFLQFSLLDYYFFFAIVFTQSVILYLLFFFKVITQLKTSLIRNITIHLVVQVWEIVSTNMIYTHTRWKMPEIHFFWVFLMKFSSYSYHRKIDKLKKYLFRHAHTNIFHMTH